MGDFTMKILLFILLFSVLIGCSFQPTDLLINYEPSTTTTSTTTTTIPEAYSLCLVNGEYYKVIGDCPE